ncbi:hypothetical protein VPHK469_0137 [Vibrio phage K469]
MKIPELEIQRIDKSVGPDAHRIKLGRVVVANVTWDCAAPKGKGSLRCNCRLPGFKNPTTHHHSVEEAAETMKHRASIWFGWVLDPNGEE